MSLMFFKNFPVPRSMNIYDGVGVDLSEVSLRFVRLVPKDGGFELRDFGEYFLPEGVISLGKIQKPDILKDILIRFKKEHNINFVRVSLPESVAYLAEMDIPSVKNSELYESIELQLEEYIPMKAADAAFDYRIIETEKNKPGMISLLVSAVSKNTASSYSDVFNSAGISLLSLEPDSNALMRAVIPKGSPETSMILDLGRVKTGVYIVSRGATFFVSDIDIGENDLPSAFMKGLNVSADEAKQMLGKLHSNEKLSAEAVKIVSSFFGEIKEGVDKHLTYWDSTKDKNGAKREHISRIVLCGSGAALLGLPEYLLGSLHVAVDVANVWSNIFSFDKDIPKIPFRDSLLYSTAIGLALYP